MANPESLSAGAEVLDAPTGDEALRGGADSGEGDADPIESTWQSEPIRERHERDKIRHTRKLVSLYERALDGDTEARTSLEADSVGRRLLGTESRVAARTQAHIPQDVAAAQEFAAALDDQANNDYAFAQRLKVPGWGKWFFQDMPAYLADQQAAVQQTAARGGDPLTAYFQELRADPDHAVLTAADWDDLDPTNFDDLAPAKAQAAIAKGLSLALAKRAAKAQVAPEEARRQARARDAAGVEHAMRNSAPMVGGRPAGQQNIQQEFRTARQAGTLTPELLQRYGAWRQAQGF